MDKMVAYCGLTCTDCPAYVATQANDWAGLEHVAAQWREQFNAPEITASVIRCDGCVVVGKRLSGYCTTCQIRACAMDFKVATCAHCEMYACDILKAFLAEAPGAKVTLDAIRQTLQ